MKRFIASGFGVGIIWSSIFSDKKGGRTLAPLLFTLIIYFVKLKLTYAYKKNDKLNNIKKKLL